MKVEVINSARNFIFTALRLWKEFPWMIMKLGASSCLLTLVAPSGMSSRLKRKLSRGYHNRMGLED
jgi:hypothetical protein